ncbi:MAG: legume lectin beta domain protein [Crocinitomicaceae bacterium]|jgi:gliding motility-associated-like protein|nr:legume lectin beta domain protein [Crocinitomicaceae bacterium]
MKKILIFSSILLNTVIYAQFGYETVGNTVGVANINNAVCGEVDSCFTLTPNQLSQSGAVWDNKPINLNYSFDATFCMTLGAEDMWGADGFAFVMRSEESDSMGQVGSGLGFLGIEPSLAIEFDTYENSDINDPVADHTALYFNGDFLNPLVSPVPLLPNSGNVEDGGYHQARIVWNAPIHQLKMYFDGFLRFTYTADIVNDVFGGDNTILWGFTASTGALSNLQQICFPRYQIDLTDIRECQGDSAAVHFYNENMTSYRWTFQDGTVIKNWNTLDFTDPFDLNDTLFYTTQPGTYYLDVEINNQMVQDSLVVSFIPLPAEPFADMYDIICVEEDTYTLSALNNGSTYQWSTGASSQQISVTSPGTYAVRIFEPVLSCSADDTIKILNFCKDTMICAGDIVPISFYEPGISSYSWTNDSGFDLTTQPFDLNDTLIYVSAAGTYYLDFVINGQALQDSLELTVIPLPEIPFSQQEVTVCLDEKSHQLDALNPGAFYLWSTGDTTQQIEVTQPGLYSVEITESNELCSSSDAITVISVCKTEVTFPNIFTPNGDEDNDYFQLIFTNSPEWIADFEMHIFNRWGQEIFQTNEQVVKWDGKIEGTELPAGVYFYTYSFKDLYSGELNSGHGNFQLIR